MRSVPVRDQRGATRLRTLLMSSHQTKGKRAVMGRLDMAMWADLALNSR